jgi:2-polyprenyl-3-methyl-5-hydroxy-6-metoxy-1,4-benzoquinol methylase
VPDWQERITHETEPAIRAEHDARYRLAAPLIASGELWCDLGCGNGIAAAAALQDAGGFTGRAVLVDLDEELARGAAGEIGVADPVVLGADLATNEGVARVTEHLGDGAVVTCFEVIEHLSTFVPLVERLVELSDRATTILSVPNDAFWAIENPHHQAMWGEGAFAELETLLPEGRVLLHQLSLQGSAILPADGEQRVAPEADVQSRDAVPTHFLAAFGPRAGELAAQATLAQVDLDEQRRWVRQREADNAMLNELLRTVDEFRGYIHDLEGRLGLPLSGTERSELPAGSET